MAKEIIERYGSKPYAFQFSTRSRTDNELDSRVTKKSGMYYINGKIETIEEIRDRADPSERILLSNMECNGWNQVVTTFSPWKHTGVFNDGDAVVTM
jgi:hypothetical protein